MVVFADEGIREGFERAVRNAKHLSAKHSAHVAAARALADHLDEIAKTGFIDEFGKLDNVSLPTFLKYLGALGLDVPVEKRAPGPAKDATAPVKPEDELAKMRKRVTRKTS